MEHNYIRIEENSSIKTTIIYQRDNNLDKKDNLDTLPATSAVFAICGRVNGEPVNPRFVGETDNLQQAVKKLFDPTENFPSECFRDFMLSIKTKQLVYELLPDARQEERINIRNNWQEKFKPECNEQLNEIH